MLADGEARRRGDLALSIGRGSLPYLLIWGVACAAVFRQVTSTTCDAFCAMYAAELSYLCLALALLLSAVVVAAQTLSHHR
jgi:hypothetical protein